MKTKQLLKPLRHVALAITALLATVQTATTHSVYIEPNESGDLVIRFAEFGDDYETSPGHLDSLENMSAWKREADEPKVLEVTKKSDHFAVTGAKVSDSLQAETGFPAMTSGSGPGRKPYFYARWRSSETEVGVPSAVLDLVPTGKPGVVRAYFRGKPLAGVDATLFTPEANDQELKTDDEGYLRFDAPDEKGLFMLKIGRHREERVGFSKGTEYGLVSHNSVITWVHK